MSSTTTSVRPVSAAPTDSSKAGAPFTAQRGTRAETVTKPVERIRKSRREKLIWPPSSVQRRASRELKSGTGQHDVDEPAHLLVHRGRVVVPRAARSVVVRLEVRDPRVADVVRDVFHVQARRQRVDDA